MKFFDPIMDDTFEKNDYEAVKTLLHNGFDLTPTPGHGTYLARAWFDRGSYSFDIVKLLIEHGEILNNPGDPSITMAARRSG